MRPVVAAAAAASLFLVVACQDHPPSAPSTERPGFAISDGAHSGGNPDFFFLPPMVPDPSSDPNFDAGQFNPGLSPEVVVCAWTGTACGDAVARFTTTSGLGSETIRVSRTDEHYLVNWRTDLSDPPLDPAVMYRIVVSVGTQQLGFADIDVVSSGKELRNVQTGENIALVDNRTLPIKFRIENHALCPGGDCTSKSIDLTAGGTLTTPDGDGVVIPPQPSGETVTVTAEACGDINVDLPKLGSCLRLTADPPLPGDGLANAATVFQCSLPEVNLSQAQRDLVTLYRQDGEVLTALPHADFDCPTPIGLGATPPRSLLAAGWQLVRRALGAAFGSRPLIATTLLHLGPAGLSGTFSDFQFVLPAQMEWVEGTQDQSAFPGTTVPYPPAVFVSDRNHNAVAGAVVTFSIGLGGGSLNGGTVPVPVTSGADGIASLDAWRLGSVAGLNTALATGRGIADPEDGGPFMPNTTPTSGGDWPVPVGTGTVTFTATAVTPPRISIDGVMSPGEWDDAATYGPFTVNLPGGESTTATLFINNDQDTLYMAVRFDQDLSSLSNVIFAIRMDENQNNEWDCGDGNGEDGFVVQQRINDGQTNTFYDEFYSCTLSQGQRDDLHGGQNDGWTASTDNGASTVIELVHYANPADAKDAVLTAGQTLKFLALVNLGPTGELITTYYPSSSTFASYTVR